VKGVFLAQASGSAILPLLTVVVGFFFLVVLILFLKHLHLWIRCVATGVGTGFFDLVGMTLRKVPAELIVQARIMGVKGGAPIDVDRLQAHYLAGGDVKAVVRAQVAARREGVDLTFEQAAGLDLAGGDVVAVVQALVAARQEGIELEFERASSLQLEGHDVMEVVRTWAREGVEVEG